jgi:hypothetical protein
MERPSKETLARMPLAEGVLWMWRWVTCDKRLDVLWDKYRGRCYEKAISFPVMVHLIADALMQHGGSGRHSFERGIAEDVLKATVQAAYKKLGRLPIVLSEAFLAECTAALREAFPQTQCRELPASLTAFTLLTLDGKAIKRVAKRLLPFRGVQGGLVGGKALVAREWSTGLAVAMRSDPDGDAHDVRLVAALVPLVRQVVSGPRLWMADCAFCDLDQPMRFTAEAGDHFLVRHHPKVKFHADSHKSSRKGKDERGRPFVEEWGWLGSERDKRRRYVRQITLPLDKEDLLLVTDLLDAKKYPAVDLLEVYGERWCIEQMFQEVTEVFGLKGLIGGTPQACIFQLSFCLLLNNMMQVVRGYVAQAQKHTVDELSGEKLFEDVQEQLIAWNVMVDFEATVAYFQDLPTTKEMCTHLRQLLHSAWNERWLKSPLQDHHGTTFRKRERTHHSTYRILQAVNRRRLKERAKQKLLAANT